MNDNSQRVNIQFSLDLDDLPTEVSRLFARASTHATDASDTFGLFEHQKDPLSVVSLQRINDIRLALTKADLVLDDLQKIVGGYLRMQADPPQAAQEEPEVHEAPRAPQPPEVAMAPPKNPFAQQLPDMGPGGGFSLEEMQSKVKKVVEAMQDEESAESTLKGV